LWLLLLPNHQAMVFQVEDSPVVDLGVAMVVAVSDFKQ
jgi:hypothetical protein